MGRTKTKPFFEAKKDAETLLSLLAHQKVSSLLFNTYLVMWKYNCEPLWFSPGTPVSSTNKTDRNDKSEILLKVALHTKTLTRFQFLWSIRGQVTKHNKIGMTLCCFFAFKKEKEQNYFDSESRWIDVTEWNVLCPYGLLYSGLKS